MSVANENCSSKLSERGASSEFGNGNCLSKSSERGELMGFGSGNCSPKTVEKIGSMNYESGQNRDSLLHFEKPPLAPESDQGRREV